MGKLISQWRINTQRGIQAILVVPEIDPELRNPPNSMISLDIESPDIEVKLEQAMTKYGGEKTIIVLVENPDKMRNVIPHIMWQMKKKRTELVQNVISCNSNLHFLIVISLRLQPCLLQLNQSSSWPIIALDKCLDLSSFKQSYNNAFSISNIEKLPNSILHNLLFQMPVSSFLNSGLSDLIIKMSNLKLNNDNNDDNYNYDEDDDNDDNDEDDDDENSPQKRIWRTIFIETIQAILKAKYNQKELESISPKLWGRGIIKYLLYHDFKNLALSPNWHQIFGKASGKRLMSDWDEGTKKKNDDGNEEEEEDRKEEEEEFEIIDNQSRVTLNQLPLIDFTFTDTYTPITGEVFHGFVMLKEKEEENENKEDEIKEDENKEE